VIRIGTAGWSYSSGPGRWVGIFYPAHGKVDHLRFYARYFNTVEVNSTFYGPPEAPTTRTWTTKTPDDFRFSIKLYHKFTHPQLFASSTGRDPKLTPADFAEFRAGIDPLAEAGKLGPLIAQFPASFKRTDESLGRLDELLVGFAPFPVVVELRHRSWTASDEVATLMRAHGASWAHIDEPRFRTSIRDIPDVGPYPYFRFHGRNFTTWWKGDRDARYDYLYSLEEQAELAQRITSVARTAQDTHVTYNNHYGAKAAANGIQMRLMLGQTIDAPIPPTLLETFPDLAKLVQEEAAERSNPERTA